MLSHRFCSKQDRWFSVQLTNRAFVVEIVDSTFNGCSEVVAFPVAEVFSQRVLESSPKKFHNSVVMRVSV